MGKGLLLLVIGVIFGSGYLLIDAKRTEQETSIQKNNYEAQLLARQIARSAANLALSEVRRDPEKYRPKEADVSYEGGEYDMSIEGPAGGPLTLTVEGRYGDAKYRISSQLELSVVGFLDALVLDSEEGTANNSGKSFDITGYDTTPPSIGDGKKDIGSGPGPHQHALRTTKEDLKTVMEAGLEGERVYGLGGEDDFVSGLPDNIDLDQIYAEAYASATMTVWGDTTITGNVDFGTPDNPVVLVVYGNATFRGTTQGYGILLVNGDLDMSGNTEWEGLVLVENGGLAVGKTGDAAIYGSTIARNNPSEEEEGSVIEEVVEEVVEVVETTKGKALGKVKKDDGEKPGGEGGEESNSLDFYMGGNASIVYSSAALRRLGDFLPSVESRTTFVIASQLEQGTDLSGRINY